MLRGCDDDEARSLLLVFSHLRLVPLLVGSSRCLPLRLVLQFAPLGASRFGDLKRMCV